MFMQLNKNIVFDNKFLISNGLDGYLRVPMTPENIIVPEELLSALFAVMHGFSGVGKTNQKPIKAMIDVLKKHDELISTKIEKGEIIEKAMSCFKGAIISKNPVFAKSETPAKQNNESHRQVSFVKPPIYLGITVESDPQYLRKLSKTFENAFNQAGEPTSLIDEFKQMIRDQTTFSPWSFPASHHITTMFIGGNKNKLKLPQCEYFEENIVVTIDIRAVIYIPGKLVAAICFP
jgi:heat shock protein HspQ